MLKNGHIKNFISFFGKEIIYGGHLQSLGAAFIASLSLFFTLGKINLFYFFSAYLMFYSLYLYNRVKEVDVDIIGNKERTIHIKKYMSFSFFILWLSLLALFIILVFEAKSIRVVIFAFFLVVLGLFYTDFFKKLTKKIILFKDVYVSLFFSALVFLPYFYFNSNKDNFLFYIGFSFFVFLETLWMQIFLDLKDVESDKLLKLKTFPVLIGEKNTILFLNLFNVFLIIFLFWLVAASFFPKEFLSLGASSIISFLATKYLNKKRYWPYIVESAKFVFWPIFIFLVKLFFSYYALF